jgi:NADH dehydrogenase FAD-containing subunit
MKPQHPKIMGVAPSCLDKTVVIIGGGYAGTKLAALLDGKINIILIERREVNVHNVAGLRAIAAEGWATRTLIPYDKLFKKSGKVVRGEVVRVMFEEGNKSVELSSGERIAFDVLVVATGASQSVLVFFLS